MEFKKITSLIFKTLVNLLAISLPLSRKVSSIITLLLVMFWILNGGYNNLINCVRNRYVNVFLLLFIILIISLSYSENKELFQAEKKISLLIFPLVFFNNDFSNQNLKSFFWWFISGCLVAAIYSLIFAMDKPELWGEDMTTEAIGISHVYFGMYLSFAVALLVYFLKVKEYSRFGSSLIMLLIAFFLIIMFIIGGKMAIISLFLLGTLAGLVFIILTKQWLKGIVFFCLPLVILFLVFSTSGTVRSRFSYIFNKEHHFVGDNAWSSIGVRFTIFKCAHEVYVKSPFIGTGLGDVQPDLDECYKQLGFLTVLGMNGHNQYVQIAISAGIIGLLCFLLVLIYPTIDAIRKNNYPYLCLIFLFAFCCLTESILERQQGVMFYAFFNSLLFFHPQKELVDNQSLQ